MNKERPNPAAKLNKAAEQGKNRDVEADSPNAATEELSHAEKIARAKENRPEAPLPPNASPEQIEAHYANNKAYQIPETIPLMVNTRLNGGEIKDDSEAKIAMVAIDTIDEELKKKEATRDADADRGDTIGAKRLDETLDQLSEWRNQMAELLDNYDTVDITDEELQEIKNEIIPPVPGSQEAERQYTAQVEKEIEEIRQESDDEYGLSPFVNKDAEEILELDGNDEKQRRRIEDFIANGHMDKTIERVDEAFSEQTQRYQESRKNMRENGTVTAAAEYKIAKENLERLAEYKGDLHSKLDTYNARTEVANVIDKKKSSTATDTEYGPDMSREQVEAELLSLEMDLGAYGIKIKDADTLELTDASARKIEKYAALTNDDAQEVANMGVRGLFRKLKGLFTSSESKIQEQTEAEEVMSLYEKFSELRDKFMEAPAAPIMHRAGRPERRNAGLEQLPVPENRADILKAIQQEFPEEASELGIGDDKEGNVFIDFDARSSAVYDRIVGEDARDESRSPADVRLANLLNALDVAQPIADSTSVEKKTSERDTPYGTEYAAHGQGFEDTTGTGESAEGMLGYGELSNNKHEREEYGISEGSKGAANAEGSQTRGATERTPSRERNLLEFNQADVDNLTALDGNNPSERATIEQAIANGSLQELLSVVTRKLRETESQLGNRQEENDLDLPEYMSPTSAERIPGLQADVAQLKEYQRNLQQKLDTYAPQAQAENDNDRKKRTGSMRKWIAGAAAGIAAFMGMSGGAREGEPNKAQALSEADLASRGAPNKVENNRPAPQPEAPTEQPLAVETAQQGDSMLGLLDNAKDSVPQFSNLSDAEFTQVKMDILKGLGFENGFDYPETLHKGHTLELKNNTDGDLEIKWGDENGNIIESARMLPDGTMTDTLISVNNS